MLRGDKPTDLLAVVVCLTLCGVASADPARVDESWRKETSEWLETIDTGGRVRVVNPSGNVYARFGGYENVVELLATIQRPAGAAGPAVTVERAGAGLDVTTEGAAQGRVDLVVFVPMGATFEARTEDGRIEIKGLKGETIASSIKGDIWIRSVEGRVRAKTARGEISAALENGTTPERQELTTVTGDIEVYLWEDADMQVRLATSGEIGTDFSIQIEHHRFEEPGKHASAIVGRGGPELLLSSKRGRIRLLRLQREFKPEDQP